LVGWLVTCIAYSQIIIILEAVSPCTNILYTESGNTIGKSCKWHICS